MMVGNPAAFTAYAVEMRSFVSDKVGQEIGLWAAAFGAPRGAMSYTAHVDGVAGAQAMSEKLVGDADYIAKLAGGVAFTGAPAQDNLSQRIHGELTEHPPVGSVATVTSVAPGTAGRPM